MNNVTVNDYYDYMLPFYKIFWHRDSESNALHYGLWEKGTKNLKEALLNTNKFMAEKAHISSKDRVLDAGCGIGGSSLWIAKNYQSEVVGITISDRQVKKARKLIEKKHLGRLVQIHLRDFLNTKFEDRTFDVVWALESASSADKKIDFLNEAYRLLRKGGRIIIADGFLLRDPENDEEKDIVDNFTRGWALPNLSNISDFKLDINKAGFKNISEWNKTIEITPSSKRLYTMSKFSFPIV